MKRLGRSLIAIFLVVAVIIIAFGIYFFLEIKGPLRIGVREVVKSFSFSSKNSLDEWDEKVLTRKSTDYSLVEYDGKKCVKASSDDSASALFYRERLSSEADPFLSWDWRAEKFPSHKKKETLSDKDEFDFAAQVYVIFQSRFFLKAKAIQYVWTHEVPAGEVAASPYTNNVRILVLESGETEGWKRERRNINEDFRRLFGREPEKDVAAVAFMTDSDSTDSSAVAYYTNISIGYLPRTKVKQGKEEPSGT